MVQWKQKQEKRKQDYEREWTITGPNVNLGIHQMCLINIVTVVGPIVEKSPTSEFELLWSYQHQINCSPTKKCYMEGSMLQSIREYRNSKEIQDMVTFLYTDSGKRLIFPYLIMYVPSIWTLTTSPHTWNYWTDLTCKHNTTLSCCLCMSASDTTMPLWGLIIWNRLDSRLMAWVLSFNLA